VKAELRSLPRSLADLVAQHLVASGRFLDDDPERAYLHARTARRLAARLGGVREAVAITAYLAEHYDEALTEFRAVRRMTGNHEVLAMMADCERALGRPEKALALSRDKHARDLSEATQIELLIVAAGARRDMGQTAAAIQTLDVPELTKRTRAEWLPRLRYAYADALEAAGRTEDALIWFHRAAGVDAEASTDAAERAAKLEGLEFTDLAEDDEDEDDTEDTYDDAEDSDDESDDAEDSDADAEDAIDAGADAGDVYEDEADAEDDEDGDADDDVEDRVDEGDADFAVEDEDVKADLDGVVDDALDGEVEVPEEKGEKSEG
jgi:tetratricopeptide (TPR) repeat protein